ncbi:MAG: PAS domain S-box protein [Bacteroidales bacterium]
MIARIQKFRDFPNFSFRKIWKALLILITGISLTLVASIYLHQKDELYAKQEFNSVCNEIRIKVITRLHSHAQLLRTTAAFLSASDSVSREDWKIFIESSQIEKNLPGIQGVGYSIIIPKNQLEQHVQNIRKQGFPDYTIKPSEEREIYTSIIYLEPFSGRNLKAFGYDMYSESIRRKAMQRSCDDDVASLSGKVILIQETEKDKQAGTLMYVPVYRKGMQHNTVEQRRSAIKAWVYSPYRMIDLMHGILGRWDFIEQERIHLKIYDDSILSHSLMYDSQLKDTLKIKDSQFQTLMMPIDFNGHKWILSFMQPANQISYFQNKISIVFISGVLISILLFLLYFSLINTNIKALRIAGKLTAELKETEANINAIFNATDESIILISADNTILNLNDIAIQRMGKAKEELIGWDLEKIIPPEVYKHNRPFIDHLLLTAKHVKFEDERNGRWMLNHLYPITNKEGKILRFAVFSRDISERKQSDKKLADFSKMFTSVVDSSTDAIYVKDNQGKYLFINNAAARSVGKIPDEIIGNDDTFIFPEREAHLIMKGDNNVMQGGEVKTYEEIVTTNNGVVTFLSTKGPITNSEGIVTGIFGIARNITERKSMEDSLRESELRFKNLFKLHNAIMLLIEPESGLIIDANDAAEKFYGFNKSTLCSKCIDEINILSAEEVKIERTNALNENRNYFVFQHRLSNGELRTVEVHSSPIYYNDKKILFSIIHDISDRKQVEDALYESESRYRLMTENVMDVIWVQDVKTGKFKFISPSIEGLLGYTVEEIISKGIEFSITAESLENLLNIIPERIERFHNGNNEFFIDEVAHIHKNGNIIWVESNSHILLNPVNGRIEVTGVIRDITKRKKAEEELYYSRTFMNSIIEHSPTSLWISDEHGLLIRMNQACRDILHLQEDEVVGKYNILNDNIIEEQGFMPMVKDVFEKGINARFIISYDTARVKDIKLGQTIRLDLDVNISPILDMQGKVIHIIVQHIDITERKKAEIKLREIEERLSLALDQSHIAYWEMDAATKIFTFNDRFYDLYATTAAKEGGYQMPANVYSHEFLLAEEEHLVADDISCLLSGEINQIEREHCIRRRDGEIRNLMVNVSVIRDTLGRVVSTRGSNQDITEMKLAKEALKKTEAELRNLNATKDKFFSIIAHDLRSPFNSFLGLTQIMAEELSSLSMEEIHKFVISMEKSATNLFRLLENLLEWSKMQQGIFVFNPEFFNLSSIVNECIGTIESAAETKGLKIMSTVPDKIELNADCNMIQTIIRNLLSNAVKFTPKGGEISVSANQISANFVEISIKDSGIGMKPFIKENLFKLDVNIARKGTEGELSTGLGLLLCKEFVEIHGGKLWAESEEGKGSCFYFTMANSLFTNYELPNLITQ